MIRMRRSKIKNQLDLFQKYDTRSLENQIKLLAEAIAHAIREDDLKKAAALAEKQRILIENQIFRSDKKD